MRGVWMAVVVAGCAGLAPVVAEMPGARVLPQAERIELAPDGLQQAYAYCADRLAGGELAAGRGVVVSRFCTCVTNTAPRYVPRQEWTEIDRLMAEGGGVADLPPVARRVADACAALARGR